ncbi:phage associated protein [Salmonella phage Vi01]|uniref:Phage associated protein n=1 Tax=Salmonella phage ViI TaxID=1987993 RepID=E1XTA3_BPSAV|nr:phage associated protein [Salmonella phage Vi01]CBW37962.1 phage associated protein [Salmonella phage Vi01]
MAIQSFLNFLDESKQLDEAFNSAPYELTFGKKNAGDIFFTFVDEDEKEFRIQFYTPQGLGKNVRQVFIGQKRGSTYPDAIGRFKNPMRVIASMIEATKQFMATPLGKTIDGFAINFSKKALERGTTLLPKIIRQSGLKQKLNVMDLTYTPIPDRAFVWVVRKGKDPAQVFDGPKMKGVTWDDPDKVGDVPVQSNPSDVGATPSPNTDWNISVMAKSNGIFSSVVKVVGANDVTLSSNDLAIMVKDGAMAKIARTQSIAQVTVFNKEYVGRGEVDRKIMAASDRQGMGWELKSGGKIVAYVEFGIGATAPVDMKTLPKTGSMDDLRNQGYIARILGIVDTYAPQQVGMYAGEKLTRVGAGKYRTSGGLDIQVYFWGIVNSKLSVEVVSDLSGNEQLMLEGDVKNAAFEIVSAISRAADSQFKGEVECRVVPINGAPYPIQKVSRSQGYSYVDCISFTLKIADALLNRFTLGKAVKLDLIKEFPRTTFIVRYDWRSKDTLMVQSSDGKTIFGEINTNSSDNAVITANLKAPSNAKIFGETVHGFSVAWDFQFPAGSQLQAARFVTNVTYDFDRNKANITTMLTENGRNVVNSSGYDIQLSVKSVQDALNETSQRLKDAAAQLSHLSSSNYNPNKLFLNDITVSKFGAIMFQDKDLAQSRNRTAVIDALARAKDQAAGGKNSSDLATYSDSIRNSAPNGRDLDWQVYVTNSGAVLNVDWSITFRRNTTEGAYREFKDQINRANQYLQTVYNDAKAKGYNPTEPNLMTLDSARQSDEWAMSNGDSAYSEYEQSLGGNLQIRLK